MKLNNKKDISKTRVYSFLIIIVVIILWTANYIFFSNIVPSVYIDPKSEDPLFPTTSVNPCQGKVVSKLNLGYPIVGDKYAEFTTSGEVFYITAKHYDHSGLFASARSSTSFYFGESSRPPIWNARRAIASNMIKQIVVRENEYAEVKLDSGTYWVWSSSGGDVELASCHQGGLTNPKGVFFNR